MSSVTTFFHQTSSQFTTEAIQQRFGRSAEAPALLQRSSEILFSTMRFTRMVAYCLLVFKTLRRLKNKFKHFPPQNNPSSVAIHEAKLLWPDQKICLVSFGTGRSLNKRRIDSQKLYSSKQISRLFNGSASGDIQTSSWKTKFTRILDAATDTEQTHHILSKFFF